MMKKSVAVRTSGSSILRRQQYHQHENGVLYSSLSVRTKYTTAVRNHQSQQQQQQQHNIHTRNLSYSGLSGVPVEYRNNPRSKINNNNVILLIDRYVRRTGGDYRKTRIHPVTNINNSRHYSSSAVSDTRENFSSTSGNNDDADAKLYGAYINNPLFQFNSTNLGLLHDNNNNNTNTADSNSFLTIPTLNSIRQLPEVDTVLSTKKLTTTSSSSMTQSLERAATVFSSFAQGGKEHKAVLALLAECYIQSNHIPECIKTIQELQSYCSTTKTTNTTTNQQQLYQIMIAQAKVYWLVGDFVSSLQICEHLIKLQEQQQQSSNSNTKLVNDHYYNSARTGLALSKLLLLPKESDNNISKDVLLDSVYTIRDPFRAIVKGYELGTRKSHNPIYQAAVYMNMGIVEIVYAETVANAHSLRLYHDVPLDRAIKYWKQALQLLLQQTAQQQQQQLKGTDPTTPLSLIQSYRIDQIRNFLQIRLNNNIAWAILQATTMDGEAERTLLISNDDNTKLIGQASEYARKALELHDTYNTTNSTKGGSTSTGSPDGLKRTLTLIAECYARSGAAVTAEGLFQSAMDETSQQQQQQQLINPSIRIDHREVLLGYSKLCMKWDKRESYGQQLYNQAIDHDTKNNPLGGWQGKSSIHSSLWFWTVPM